VGVVAGLVGVHFTGWLWLDPVVAVCVAGNIVREGVSLVWRSADGLMDMAVEPDVRAQIEKTLAAFGDQPIRFDHVVTRRAGQRRYVEMHMHMPASWTLGRAAALRAEVERALMRDVSGLRTTIELLPTDVEAYVDDTAEMVAQARRAARDQAAAATAPALAAATRFSVPAGPAAPGTPPAPAPLGMPPAPATPSTAAVQAVPSSPDMPSTASASDAPSAPTSG
jgi:hypothetical protein